MWHWGILGVTPTPNDCSKNMSLFFEAVGQAKRAKGIRQQRNAESLQKIGCAVCPLNKAKVHTPKMQPTLADNTLIYFLAEGPGQHEDEVSGKPLTGPSGKLLRECISDDIIEYCSFDNCVRDRPPNNRNPEWTEIEACRGHVSKSIEQAKPKLIVGLGAFAQQWMLGSSDSSGMRGRLFAVRVGSHPCWFMPTYHPARVMHSASEQNGKGKRLGNAELLRTYLGRTFKFDIEKACNIVNSLEEPIIETEDEIRGKIQTFNGSNFDSLIELLNKAKKSPVKAIDIETNALRPYSKNAAILTCAISFNSTNIAFAIDHNKAKWSPQQRSKILALLKELLVDDTTKVSHNVPFESEWFIAYFGKEVINHCAWECTQIQAHFLDERRGAGQSDDDSRRATYQSLDFLVKMHFGINFKGKFKVDRKNMAQADIAETLLYNGADTYFGLRLWHRQNQLLRASGLYNAALTAMPRQPTIALAQYLGMPVNQIKLKELQRKLDDQIAVLKAEIESVDVVKQYIKDKPVKYKDKDPFNPMGEDAIVLFRDYLKRSEIKIENGKNVRWSVDKRILEKIDHPLAKLIVSLRNKSKMKSTYVDGFELGKGKYIWPDGKIHCNFNATFTTTGRFSSDEPNAQNWPQRSDSWVREPIEAPDGHVIIAADFGQLEMCGAAMCSKDPVLIKMLWDDYDTHMEWAGKLAAICPDCVRGDFTDPKIAKGFRSLVKNKLVFPAIYGASNRSIASYLGIEEHYIDTLMDEFWETFQDLKNWQDRLIKNYRKDGFVMSPTGRRRHHPLTSNEAINAPIQCLASEIVVDAMTRMSYKAATENKWHLHPLLNIHDDLSFIVPKDKLESSIKTIYTTMLTPTFEGIINVPLSVSISTGKDWFHMHEYGKYWSHKDL